MVSLGACLYYGELVLGVRFSLSLMGVWDLVLRCLNPLERGTSLARSGSVTSVRVATHLILGGYFWVLDQGDMEPALWKRQDSLELF